jgi:DNA-binding transcriptional MerR regulator
MSNGMHIGQLAACFGLNPKTIRYYEAIGLLPRADRSASGYRRYNEQDIERLSFIRRAKTLGLSLVEIRGILSLQAGGKPPCRQVLDLIDQKIRIIEQRIYELGIFRAELTALQTTWTGTGIISKPGVSSACICPIIEQQDEVADHPLVVHEDESMQHH